MSPKKTSLLLVIIRQDLKNKCSFAKKAVIIIWQLCFYHLSKIKPFYMKYLNAEEHFGLSWSFLRSDAHRCLDLLLFHRLVLPEKLQSLSRCMNYDSLLLKF